MSAGQKLRAFRPQILGGAVSTALGIAADGISGHGAVAVALAVWCGVVGIVSLISAFNKAFNADTDGWEAVVGECEGCRRLKDENAKLLEAIR